MSRELSMDPYVTISAQIPYSLRQAAVAIARAEGTTLSDEIRRALGLLVRAQATDAEHDLVSTT